MGEISRGDANAPKDASFGWSEELTLVEPYLKGAPFEELCCDDVMVRNTLRSLDSTFISFPFPPTIPHFHEFHESLSEIRGYYPSLDLYYAYLDEMPRKIMSFL